MTNFVDYCEICGAGFNEHNRRSQHHCNPKKLAIIEASRNRDDDAVQNRKRTWTERFNDGIEMGARPEE